MICLLCGGTCRWVGPLSNVQGTKCMQCGTCDSNLPVYPEDGRGDDIEELEDDADFDMLGDEAMLFNGEIGNK